MRVLIVEDETALAQALVEALEGERYAVDLAADGVTAAELASVNDYDLVILDWSIPPPTGIELLQSWRAADQDFPVLMLTARHEVVDRISGLDSGADDYLTKPFAFEELLARVRTLLRRGARPIRPLRAGDVVIDRASRRVTVGDEPTRLSPKEFGLLEYLVTHRDRAVSRSELGEHVWDDSFDPLSNSLEVLIHRLRRKIDGDRPEKLLHTVLGAGYLLSTERTLED